MKCHSPQQIQVESSNRLFLFGAIFTHANHLETKIPVTEAFVAENLRAFARVHGLVAEEQSGFQ